MPRALLSKAQQGKIPRSTTRGLSFWLLKAYMDDKEFELLAQAALARIQAGLENADLDFETPAEGILEVEFDNGSKMVINRHMAAQEIWVAAKSGGYHFHPIGGVWKDTRDQEDLYIKLARLIIQQGGVTALF
jgi:iron-sulfur cluster assembly protein CyaY